MEQRFTAVGMSLSLNPPVPVGAGFDRRLTISVVHRLAKPAPTTTDN
ncbi:hypothetical protein H6G17_07980 [Chroococcidiopsis sp. FACHB-1243]|nr:hypothetical protein [Chroococcidiopsis sp. [FACHB-1243]]